MRHATLIFKAIAAAGLLFGASPNLAAHPPTACAYLSKSVNSYPAGPVFLPSYPTIKSGPLNQAAFLYDNALATMALIACGEPHEATRIGDAILTALDHDRYWHDGRLRNAYLAGSVSPGPVKLAGWWDPQQKKWLEDRYQVGSSTGNLAWAILALLALDTATGDGHYRNGAARIGDWTIQWRSTDGSGGFTGGTFAHEPTPRIERWKSTEHNTDLAAAFWGLARATGNKTWNLQAESAQNFVRAMWTPGCNCFAVGTADDGVTQNHLLALDAQIWPLLALPEAADRYRSALTTATHRLCDREGFAYSEAQRGLWTEGTAQVALLLELSAQKNAADNLIRLLGPLQTPDGSYYATRTSALPTGFMLDTDPTQPRQYRHLPHLAAVSWVALAENRYNPFTQKPALP